MSIFKAKGFDTIIGKDASHIGGDFCFSGTVIVDGVIEGNSVKQNKVEPKASLLHVNGRVTAEVVEVNNLTVNGAVKAKTIHVEDTLAIKSGANICATAIYYRTLVIEPGAVILGELKHLDHVSEGEQV